MIRAIRRYFAQRAAAQAAYDYQAYQTQPAYSGWNIRVAVALQIRADAYASRYAALI